MPERVQLSRAKGWRMPPNTRKVDRSTAFGNPWSILQVRRWLASVGAPETYTDEGRAANCVAMFRLWIVGGLGGALDRRKALLARLPELRGKNLACWCKPGAPCHADVLLELANQ